MLFCTEFADGEGLNGQDDTRRMDEICDFLCEMNLSITDNLNMKRNDG